MLLKMMNVIFILAFIASVSSQKIIGGGVTCRDIIEIVNHHNEVRKLIAQGKIPGQPKASNLQTMIWDENLAHMSQQWACNGKFEHNQNTQDSRFAVGENLYTTKTKNFSYRKPQWIKAIDAWFNEYKDYEYKPLVSDPKTGHYTQVVWHNTIYLGCGFCWINQTSGSFNAYYVCNYGPAGNFLSEYPYKTGDGCENLCCTNYNCTNKYGSKCPRSA